MFIFITGLSYLTNLGLTLFYGNDSLNYISLLYFYNPASPLLNAIFAMINPFTILSIYTILRQERLTFGIKNHTSTIILMLLYFFLTPVLMELVS